MECIHDILIVSINHPMQYNWNVKAINLLHIIYTATVYTYVHQAYSRFRVFSPDCTLHTAITHMISILERSRLTHDYTIGIHVRFYHSNTFIT